jgi:hypothetical protein
MARNYRVVLAHGRAAQFEIPSTQSAQWAEALKFAMSRVNSPFASSVQVDYAYFGDIWRPDVQHDSPTFKTKNRTQISFDRTTGRIVETPPSPQPGGLGAGTRAAHAFLPDWILGPILRRAIPDVFQYLEDDEYQAKSDERLITACAATAAGPGADLIVGFSMGSIVGYHVLARPPAGFPVQSFITVGSPIGLGPINRPLRQQLDAEKTPFPPGVRLWLNIWNDDDVATGIHGDQLAELFPDVAPPDGFGARAIQSGRNYGMGPSGLNQLAAHNALDYLSSLAMGVALHTALRDLETADGG